MTSSSPKRCANASAGRCASRLRLARGVSQWPQCRPPPARQTTPPAARSPTRRCGGSGKFLAEKFAGFETSRSSDVKLPGNMQSMMQQAQKMQEKLQQEIALIKVEATAGGGMVTVQMDGQKNLLTVKIDPEVAGDVEMLQDMIVAAANEAVKKVEDQIKGKMGGMLGGRGRPPGV